MKKLFNGLQWVVLLGVVAGIIWLIFKPSPPVVYAPQTWSNWDGFMVLSYAGVTRDDSVIYPSSETLISHIEVLQSVGYNTITPEDALAFLEGRFPLPDKALLILFEGARKETFMPARQNLWVTNPYKEQGKPRQMASEWHFPCSIRLVTCRN